MTGSSNHSTSPPSPPMGINIRLLLLLLLLPIITSILLNQLDSLDPAPIPELTRDIGYVPRSNPRMLRGSQYLGAEHKHMFGPEDLVYDPETGIIYTGCDDGWIKRVGVLNGSVENWVNTGGRPLGLVYAHHQHLGQGLIVADAVKGLLKVSKSGEIKLLTESAEGQNFRLTDGVDIGDDGTIYFTDASHKYNFHQVSFDFLEGRPYGRFMSYNPSTLQTNVLLNDLYFPNGVAVSPDQNFVIFCETPLRKCTKYYIRGEKKGSTEIFVKNLPGMPDNIHYDGEGHYWIGLSTEPTFLWYLTQRSPYIRKIIGIVTKYVGAPNVFKNGGAVAVDVEGKMSEHYHDPGVSMISSAVKIGECLYCGSIGYPYIIRINTTKYPAKSNA